MKRFGWIVLGVTVVGGLASTLPSCSKNLACGPGTVEQNGECVTSGAPLQNCGDGGVIIGGTCYPVICGANTKFDPASGTCIGVGGMSSGCQATCSAPGTSTVCVTGTAKLFVSGTTMMPTATSMAKVRVYDPIAFATNPNTPPVATVNIEDQGCFIADGVPRFSSGLIAVAVDDQDMPGSGGTYAQMGAGAILRTNQNVTGLVAYGLLNSEVATWQQQLDALGGTQPPGCASGLAGCGAWIGDYIAMDNMTHIAGVRPTRPGDDPPTTNVFCFGADKGHLDPNQKITTSVGMCMISPDSVEGHAGTCVTPPCMCGATPCNPTFTAATGGTAAGVFFYQPFFSTTM
jgi:hypothetical protein